MSKPESVPRATGSTMTIEPAFGRLRLRTLVGLRWMAIVGQTATVLVVYAVLDYDLPLPQCLAAIAVSAWINLSLAFALPSQRLVQEWEAAAQLFFDLFQLSFLLSLTGGIENPFCLLLIVPATIAAATLRLRWSLAIVYTGLLCVALLSVASEPLPWDPPGAIVFPDLYRFGSATAISIGLIFTAAYSWRVSVEEARLADALTATQAILAREQRLAAVGGLAAAAAHELGTPLATIQLTSKELARTLPDGPDQEDAALIYSQSQRCREILRNLTAHHDHTDPTMEQMSLGQMLREAGEEHATAPEGKALLYEISGPENSDETADSITIIRSAEIMYGLGNLVENGLQYAKSTTTLSCSWDKRTIQVMITDDGPGFDPDILPRLGEPYVTTRGHDSGRQEKREGMGLGFFIAKTLLERSGAKVKFGNRTGPHKGARVRVEWSRAQLEIVD